MEDQENEELDFDGDEYNETLDETFEGDELLDEQADYAEAEGMDALEEGYQEGAQHGLDDGEEHLLDGLGEDVEEHVGTVHQNGNDSAAGHGSGQRSAGSKKIIDLTKSSNRLERLQHRNQPPQPNPQQPIRHQQPDVRVVPRQQPRGTGIKRYFMLKSINNVNWDTARKYGCWATQPQNEKRFDEAFNAGNTVIFFLSINQSGCIQGYGRMMSSTQNGPEHVPWQDIKEQVANFRVAWDCTAPLSFDAVRNLINEGPVGNGLPLNRQKDGTEIAPRCGEPLLASMNRNAVQLGMPPTGPFASWGLKGPTAAAGMQQRMVLGRGVVAGRGMVVQGGRGVPGRGLMPGRGMAPGRGMVQPPPPPRPGGPGYRPGQQQPTIPARFVGRLGGLTGPGPQMQQQQLLQHQDQHQHQQHMQHQQRRGTSPPPRSYHSGGDGYREPYRAAYRSRSRSRSPVSRGAARGDSRTRGEAPGRQLETAADSRGQLETQGSENVTYEMYLAAYDKVQQRLKTISKITDSKAEQPQQQPQPIQVQQRPGQLRQVPVKSEVDAGVGALVPYAGGSSPRGVNGAAAAAGVVQQRQQLMQQRVRSGGAVSVNGMMNAGGLAAGRAAMQVQNDIPTLEEYIQRIRTSYMQKRGQPCPYTDEQIAVKYNERMAQLRDGAGAAAAGPAAIGTRGAAAGRLGTSAAGRMDPGHGAAAGRPPVGQQNPAAGVGAAGMSNMPSNPATSGPMSSNPMANAAVPGMNPAAAMMNPMMAMNPAMNPQAAMMMGGMNPMAAMAMMGAGGMANPMGMGVANPLAAGMGMNPMMMQNMMGQGQMGGRGGGNMGGQRGRGRQHQRGRF